MPDLSDTIEQVAGEPQSSSGDNQSATNQPLPDLIKADQYLASKTGLEGTNANGGPKSGWGKLRIGRAVPPGAV